MTPEQLKASILQRAMQGKLLPQNPEDEPASELLKRIKKEKESLIKEGKIKRDKKESQIIRRFDGSHYEKFADGTTQEVEVPYEIPDSWQWVRLGEIGNLQTGNTPDTSNLSYYDEEFIPFVKPADFVKGSFKTTSYLSKLGLSKGRLVKANSILMVCIGGSRGKTALTTMDISCNQQINTISPYIYNTHKYIYYFFISPIFQEWMQTKATGTATPIVNKKTWGGFLLPLPPLAEQKRIVEQVEKLLAQVEEYAKHYHRLKELNKKFPDQLKKSILQYAMQGKLVPQDDNDDSVEHLLENIRAEKEQLFAQGKLKKKDLQSSIIFQNPDDKRHYEKVGKTVTPIEVPYDIPETWRWVRLGDLSEVISDGTHKTPTYTKKGVPFLSVQNISSGFFDFSKIKYVSQEEHEQLCKRIQPKFNDILLCRIGTLGKAIKNTLDFDFSIFVSLGLIRLIDNSMLDYVITVINSPTGNNWIEQVKVGGGTHTYKINLRDIPLMLIPFPSSAEQDIILQKLNTITAKIENLR